MKTKQDKKIILFASVTFVLFLLILSGCQNEVSFEKRRAKTLSELDLAIQDAVAEEKYHCCIDPPCTMCYLGHWIWENGSCYCDDMIAQGKLDQVCPECQKGANLGICESVSDQPCDSDNGEIFKPANS
jgi:hypothetical protein